MTTTTNVRVRFAPSPTGFFHVGGARTALYNWLVARQNNGSFLLRIEDTDRDRSEDQWTEGIVNALSWLGITWDEGPFHQSERHALYNDAITRLIANGHVYACNCTREEIDARIKARQTPGYDGFCRDRNLEPGPGKALRFRVPDSGTTTVHDLVRGDVEFANSTIEDFVIVKSNGDPLYVLAVVVDDIDMAITHVIRAEEHLPTTPKAILIWHALGDIPLPAFAHLPVLVNEKRQKLSKRRDRVAVEDYRDLGYLPEAIINYLCLLGWAPNDGRELLTVEEMILEFRLEEVNKSPAFFDEKRLDHFNGLYIRALAADEFVRRAMPFISNDQVPWTKNQFDQEQFFALAPLIQERITTLGEIPNYIKFLFSDPYVIEEAVFEKAILKDETGVEILRAARSAFADAAFDHEPLKDILISIGEQFDKKLSKTQAPIRVATMGSPVGLPLFESLVVLGRSKVLARIDDAILIAERSR
ncbi:MAG TPA: glutamate--tRNA ligase [Acidimicrobiales bacterium]|nr:glutamate--tRNA ligase [Acidimicrobiales bacterium]